MGRKGKAGEQHHSKDVSNQKDENNPVSQLKRSVEKLNDGITKLGVTLGVELPSCSESIAQSALKKSKDLTNSNMPSAQAKVGTVGKSALRTQRKSQSQGREVQFDLCANTVKLSSDESVRDTSEHLPMKTMETSSATNIHPVFLDLAVRCDQELIFDLDVLCQEFISVFQLYLSDWVIRREREGLELETAGHDLDLAIRPQLAHLTQDGRWPLPLALGNIVRQMKKEINKIGKLDSHGNMQAECPVVNRIFLDSAAQGYSQMYTVIDSEMNGRGMQHVKSFLEKGIRCRYASLNSIGMAMKNCSMVLLGCSAVLSNGSVAAAKGSLQVALTAKAFNIPVLVASQTFKFVDKVQSYGRMALLGKESIELVPADLVTAIVTDIRILPPSSAPAVLKAKALDME
uniref:Translation initiation factor eIF2B subunit delta n=1 Tax=Heterorhabditis bacteriophora TaxID=37862 RepID=A0A1I7XLD5_HETBA